MTRSFWVCADPLIETDYIRGQLIIERYEYDTRTEQPGMLLVFSEPNSVFDLWDFDNEVWGFSQLLFRPYVLNQVANARSVDINNPDLYAEVLGVTTYKKVLTDPLEPFDPVTNPYIFEEDLTNQTLQVKLDIGTEASLTTKVGTTPNSPSLDEIEAYKYRNMFPFVTRRTMALSLVELDKKRQPFFNAEKAVYDKMHSNSPYTDLQDALDLYNLSKGA